MNIVETASTIINQPSHGSMHIRYGKPSVEVTREKDWNLYSRGTKFPANVVNIYITVSRTWDAYIRERGLSVVEGMLTLSAKHLRDDGNTQLYTAEVAEQKAGYNVVYRKGTIARSGEVLVFGGTPTEAVKKLYKEIKKIAVCELRRNYGSVI